MGFLKSRHRMFRALIALVFVSAASIALPAQTSRWAAPEDPVAKTLVEWERKWAESGCTHNGIEQTILADDFHGIAPDGSHYSKKEAVSDAANNKTSERECKMFEVKVHFFGDNMAILYGSESAIRSPKDGKEHSVKLTWTDTWLKRNGKWQVVAAEDLPTEQK
jgi:hypothetical protein